MSNETKISKEVSGNQKGVRAADVGQTKQAKGCYLSTAALPPHLLCLLVFGHASFMGVLDSFSFKAIFKIKSLGFVKMKESTNIIGVFDIAMLLLLGCYNQKLFLAYLHCLKLTK